MQMKFFVTCLSGALLLSGCAGHRHPPYGHGRVPVGLQVTFITQAPPPPRRVAISPAPVAGAIWIDGYWNWTGARFVWVDGFWDRNPPRGNVWERSRWMHTKRGWYRKPGRWRKR